jgi:hypothetical protein
MINDITMQVVADEKEQLVVIKPVCEILGVDYPGQYSKLKNHPIFGSTIVLSSTVGADEKSREMACIPLRFFSSWLFSINPDNVKEEVRDNLIQFQLKCNDVLYNYFFRRADFALKKEKAVAYYKEVYDEKAEELQMAKSEYKRAEKEFNDALNMTYEDYEADQRQLRIPGFE